MPRGSIYLSVMMKRFRYQFVLMAALVWFTGCATQKIDPSVRHQIHTVGVASLLGGDVHLQFQGTTAFGNRSFDEPAPDFALNATAEQAAIETLKPSYQVANVGTAARTALPDASFKSAFLKINCRYWNPQAPELAPEVQKICATRHLDALIVIYPAILRDDQQENRGVGLLGSNIFGIKGFSVCAVMDLSVYSSSGNLLITKRINGPFDYPKEIRMENFVRDFEWQNSLSLYSPEQRRVLIDKLQNLVRYCTQTMLTDSGL